MPPPTDCARAATNSHIGLLQGERGESTISVQLSPFAQSDAYQTSRAIRGRRNAPEPRREFEKDMEMRNTLHFRLWISWWSLISIGFTFAALLVLGTGEAAAAEEPLCQTRPSIPFTLEKGRSVQLTPADKRTKTPPPIKFDRSRGAKSPPAYLYKQAGAKRVRIKDLAWDATLVSTTTDDEFPNQQIGVTFTQAFDTLKVDVCLDARGVAAGSYAGTLTFGGGTVRCPNSSRSQ